MRPALLVLLAALAAAPAYLVQLRAGPVSTTVLELLLLAGLLLFGLDLATRRVAPRAWPLLWPALALVATGLLAVALSPDRRGALGLYRAYILEPVVVAYALNCLLTEARHVWAGVGALCAGAAVAAGAQVATAVSQWPNAARFDTQPPTGFFENANFTALLCAPALMLSLAFATALWRGHRRAFPPAAVLCLVLALGVLLSYSRGGFAATAAGLLCWVGLAVWRGERLRPRVVLAWSAAAAAVAAALFVALPGLRLRLLHQLNPSDPHNTLNTRFPIWDAALRMLRDHPLQGIGIREFGTQLKRYAPGLTETHEHPHNLVLNLWLCLGVLGLAAYTWCFVALAKVLRAGRRLKDHRGFHLLHAGVAAAVVAILVHGLVETPIWKNDLSLDFWAMVAFATAALASQRAEAERA
ncbi:MAG: O-antigen ligase family protein [Candidatus Dormibacteria bacterium]